MSAGSHYFRLLACLTCALLVDACSMFPSSKEPSEYAYRRRMLQAQREKELQSDWRGRSYKILLENFGTPKMMMNVPGRNHLQTSVAVFGVTDDLSQCIDAFTLMVANGGELVIADYFCR